MAALGDLLDAKKARLSGGEKALGFKPSETEFVERKEPTFVQFVRGEQLEGILLKRERIMIGDPKKPAMRYTLMDADSGELFCFLGTYDLDTKFRTDDIGYAVRVTLEGTDPSVSKNGNEMKKFRVSVSKNRVSESGAVDPTLITDDDIPF
jgi:hypothetical protein